jgi:hypothetical protein
MRQILKTLFTLALTLTASLGFAAKSKTELLKVKKSTRDSKYQNVRVLTEVNRWNHVCQELLETSVRSTRKLEKSVQRKKKMTEQEFNQKIHDELLVVQLNAWVCAAASERENTRLKNGIAAEELFLQDYSRLVQSKKL